MITVERVTELASYVRADGADQLASDLETADAGVFSGTERAMKLRFLLAATLRDERLSASTRTAIQTEWQEL